MKTDLFIVVNPFYKDSLFFMGKYYKSIRVV